jgi:hypothetical protein
MPIASSEQSDRRDAIRALLGEGPTPTQQALVEELARQGFAATQSSVSRDLRELGAVKTTRGYELPEIVPGDDSELESVAEFIRWMRPAGGDRRQYRRRRHGICRDRLGEPPENSQRENRTRYRSLNPIPAEIPRVCV